MKTRSTWFALVLLLIVHSAAQAAQAASDGTNYRIRGIFVGMSEKQLQDTAGELERLTKSDTKELVENPKVELWTLRKDKDTFVAIDKDTRKVMLVAGSELTKDGQLLFLVGDFQYKVPLSMMPMQHDDNWVFHNDRVNIAIQFTVDATKTAPTIARVILEDPSIKVKGGWLGGVDPRPGPKNNGSDVR